MFIARHPHASMAVNCAYSYFMSHTRVGQLPFPGVPGYYLGQRDLEGNKVKHYFPMFRFDIAKEIMGDFLKFFKPYKLKSTAEVAEGVKLVEQGVEACNESFEGGTTWKMVK